MSTHNMCFHAEIRKISVLFVRKKALYLVLHVQLRLLDYALNNKRDVQEEPQS